MSTVLERAIRDVKSCECAFCRFITANDVGETGSHQVGFYIPKDSWSVFFDTPGIRGENKDRKIQINWNGDFTTESRAIYYGRDTRNEYRVTRFGKGFPFLEKQYSGSLLTIARMEGNQYSGYVLDKDEDIDEFISSFMVSPVNNICFIDGNIGSALKNDVNSMLHDILSNHEEFPNTSQMSCIARDMCLKTESITDHAVIKDPDKALTRWIDAEFSLFKAFEEREFKIRIGNGFETCQGLIDFANSLTNRRKARAGKSLEHHLAKIFTIENLRFEEQVVTEGNKKPDFIFPDGESYHNLIFPTDGLTFLGAKTTCKDRWRQVLNEANRISHKYLFTLQPGISTNQLDEMRMENLTLVVPKSNLHTFAQSHRGNLLTLDNFIGIVKDRQTRYYALDIDR